MKKILIVEDVEFNLDLLVQLLEEQYELVTARDGAAGVEMALRERPDLILMDIQLPEVSGLEITKWLKDDEELKSIPVIAVTAFAMKGDEEKIRQGGCEAYIAKPISVAHFVDMVRQFIGRSAAEA